MVSIFQVFSFLLSLIFAAPITNFNQYSPVFSLIAFHNGSTFTYNLVYFDGIDLKLRSDNALFLGRINSGEDWVLNIPQATQPPPSSVNVLVEDDGKLSSTYNTSEEATSGFAIANSLLTFENSTEFIACSNESYLGDYDIYIADSICPNNSSGFDIVLMVQLDSTVNFNLESK
ncbi:hypothetical protein DFJ63DRAFT_314840 [Scheffersomyces coipomensis]|uniref:uncharacterized protein n=1 Tax=Scheffersomyces coipomensis TaxID=1788519 RepID=UPI00315E0007